MLDSVHKGLPAVMEAFQLTTKVSRVGFDWPTAGAALEKLDEEALELRDAVKGEADPRKVAEEVGDLLFVAVNVARLTGVDPESALKAANRKFRRRFRHIEERLRSLRPQARRLDPRGDGPPLGRGEEPGAVRPSASGGALETA